MAKLKNNFKFVMALVAGLFGTNAINAQETEQSSSAGSGASSAASGSLSAGAIAAAVAAAAALAAAADSDDNDAPVAAAPSQLDHNLVLHLLPHQHHLLHLLS